MYHIRQLQENELPLYKSMRLEALRLESSMFRRPHAEEAALPDATWLERLTHPGAVFGLFENDTIIGITGVRLLDGQVGYLGQSYIRKEYRGRGLSAMLYQARIAWAKKMQLKQLQVGHRENNLVSKAAIQRYGFTYSHREPSNWPDGSTEDVLYYVLDL
ncbi:GNAT family N-acetyltransferase [Chitinophaga qingshengii]|uniref:GNAT family N-acetyltransferase n=1 Tax=Chitinophaga qingshengii TaxID=1569794 RepID=A0ABR7TH53_9BACT|nr:GNAT family N-acetyltransferase [Chitinophaga qingshengii]MBC9928841.1 GNAT family N-acetyltransferase [Chitinophaga qingshengii]